MIAPNRLGIEMLTLLGMNPIDHVRLAGELGCVAISTGLTGMPLAMFGIAPELHPTWSLEADAALRREMQAAMHDTGVHIGLGEGFRVRSDGDVRDRAAGLDLMAELGARRINAVSMEADHARSLDQLAHLAEMVIERGMIFTVEFAPPNALATLADARDVVDHIGRGRCRILIDSMHFFRSGATLDDLRALDPDLIGYAQLSDVPMVSPFATYMEEAMFNRLLPGEGDLPLADFVAALPADVEIGIEVPNLVALRTIGARGRALQAVEAARAVGA